tara:strand:- start:338 stop:3016 length:2679 start_codon:yes stop_codon:yes gene_type:complete
MAKRESIVPGLGKQQAKVLNNEAGRRAEHKRHLEELGFPKEVDPAFMRYAPVSYDDETPYPSKVVNQAGEDLGFTPKDSLMKSDIQSIVKEAVQEVFIQKQKFGGIDIPDSWAEAVKGGAKATANWVKDTYEKQGKDVIAALLSVEGGGKLGLTIDPDKNPKFDTLDSKSKQAIADFLLGDKSYNVQVNNALDKQGRGSLDVKDLNTDPEKIQSITVDPKATDPVGVPLASQPGGRPDAGKTYEAGKGQTKDQSMDPIKVTPDQPDEVGVPLRFQPGMRGTPAGRGETQEFVPGPGQTKDQVTPPGGKFGGIGARQIKVEAGTGANEGKLVGTISGSGTSPYRVSVDPSDYGGVKAGDIINYNPSKDPVGSSRDYQVRSVTEAGTPVKRIFTRPGSTLAEAQARIARDNPAAQPKDSPYLKNMQKYQAWLQKAEDEGAMAKVQLDRVSDLASMMHDILEDEDQLPGWIQNKISDSLHNLEASITHVMYDEKEDRDLVKSKEIFQDFLVRAPQDGGTLLNDELFLRKFWMGALVAVAGSVALKALPKLIKVLPKVFKGTGKGKKAGTKDPFGLKSKKPPAWQNVTDDFKAGDPKSLADAAKKGGLTNNLLKVGGLGLAGGSIEQLLRDSEATGDITATESRDALSELEQSGQDFIDKFNKNLQASSQNLLNKIPSSVTNELNKYLQPAQSSPPPQPSPSNQQIGDGLTDRELGRRGVDTLKPSYIDPIYDTSPEYDRKVKEQGAPSKIIGADVDGQKYQFKKPITSMSGIKSSLQTATPVTQIVKEAIFELSKAKKKGGRKRDPRLARAGVEGFNKPKRTPKHPTKSHIVVAKEGNKIKTIRYGQQGAKTAGDPKKGESEKMKKKRKSFKARHRKNIKRGKMSAAYWADRSKW